MRVGHRIVQPVPSSMSFCETCFCGLKSFVSFETGEGTPHLILWESGIVTVPFHSVL